MTGISNPQIPILLDEAMLQYGYTREIVWEPEKAPHMAIIGNTGSGKTYFSKLLLGKIAIYSPDSQIYVCDFKGDSDFAFLDGCNHCFRFIGCQDGLQQLYDRLQQRQSGQDKSQNMVILFFDEWASYCNSLDKKFVEAEKQKMSNLLMLGRSYHISVLISQQRADAQYFSTARDNLNMVIGLGNLSEESKQMFFNQEFRKEMLPDRRQGTGYMLINGTAFTPIVVQTIKNIDRLHLAIKLAVTR